MQTLFVYVIFSLCRRTFEEMCTAKEMQWTYTTTSVWTSLVLLGCLCTLLLVFHIFFLHYKGFAFLFFWKRFFPWVHWPPVPFLFGPTQQTLCYLFFWLATLFIWFGYYLVLGIRHVFLWHLIVCLYSIYIILLYAYCRHQSLHCQHPHVAWPNLMASRLCLSACCTLNERPQ